MLTQGAALAADLSASYDDHYTYYVSMSMICAQEPVLQSSGAQGLAAPPFDELAWWPETTNTTNNMHPAAYSCCFFIKAAARSKAPVQFDGSL